MKDLKRKRITASFFLVIACLVIGCTSIVSYFTTAFAGKTTEASSQATAFVKTFDSMTIMKLLASEGVDDDMVSDARLFASAIAQEDLANITPKEYGNGYIVSVERGDVTLPDGFPGSVKISAADFSEDYGILHSGARFMPYAKVKKGVYYIDFSSYEKFDIKEDDIDISAALSNLANANSCDYLYLQSSDLTEDTLVYIGTNDYSECKKLSDIGLSGDKLNTLKDKGSLIAVINGSPKWLGIIHPDDYDVTADILVVMDVVNILFDSLDQSVFLMLITMIILVTLAVWAFSVFNFIRDNVLNEEQRKNYNPDNMKRKTASVLLASVLIFFVASIFFFSIDSLFTESTHEDNILHEYIARMSDDEGRTEIIWDKSQKRYVRTAKSLASLIDNRRDLQNDKWLRQAAEIIDADYIMIYDSNGDEVISSSEYRGMSLGTDKESATYDFRRLLRGVKSISHAGVKDEITGLKRDMHGISLNYLSDENSYGALIIAVDPDKQSTAKFSDIDSAAYALSPVNGFISGVDPETGIIKYSSDKKMRGAKMKEICRQLDVFEDSFMGFVNIRGTNYYLRSVEHDGLVYYCGITQKDMFREVLPRAFRVTLVFVVLAALLTLIIFSGYDQQTFNEYAGKEDDSLHRRIRAKAKQVVASSDDNTGQLSRQGNAFLQQSYLSFLQDDLSPGDRAKSVLQFLILVSVIIISLFVFVDKSMIMGGSGGNDVIEYILHGDWDRGFNLFSIAAILFLLNILVVGLYLLRLIAGFLYLPMDTRSRTIFVLSINVIRNLAVVVVVLLSLGYLGVDARAIAASAGLVGIAISLGAKDLIADIISGINILADKSFQIGDIVSIGDFRGEVADISIRSTKLIGQGDNIKTIRNSAIQDVVNYSRLNSWYPLTLTVSSSQDLVELEDMLKEELPKISEAHPEMISGPRFRGVESISGDKVTILILTECKEEYFNRVQRDVNREVRELFKKHDIELY